MLPGNQPIEILSRKLYWVCDRTPPSSRSRMHVFTIDQVRGK